MPSIALTQAHYGASFLAVGIRFISSATSRHKRVQDLLRIPHVFNLISRVKTWHRFEIRCLERFGEFQNIVRFPSQNKSD